MNSWDALYYQLRWNNDGLRSAHEPSELPAPLANQHEGSVGYHKGRRFNDLEVGHDAVTVHFVDRRGQSGKLSGELLIGADGSSSAVRRKMLGEADPERRYAGYVLWRGVVKESEVSNHTRKLFEGHFTFLVLRRQYMIWSVNLYHISGEHGSLSPGERLLNFAWYTHASEAELPSLLTDIHGHQHRWSVPIGLLQPEAWVKQLQKGEYLFPPAFRELASKIAQPFLQVITDCASPKAVFEGGKVVLLGDALSQIRPYSGKGTSQAAAQCLAMERVIKGEIGWREWEKQCLEVAWLNLLESVSWGHYYMGNTLQWGTALISHWLATKWLGVSKSILG
ncbi:MAG: hypothetical protein Q9165_002956 [Trypethelium subeluteriae]